MRRERVGAAAPIIHLELDNARAAIPFLSWDTEGGNRAQTNLLRANSPLVLRARIRNQWHSSGDVQARVEHATEGRTLFRLALAADVSLSWTIDHAHDRLTLTVAGQGNGMRDVEALDSSAKWGPMVSLRSTRCTRICRVRSLSPLIRQNTTGRPSIRIARATARSSSMPRRLPIGLRSESVGTCSTGNRPASGGCRNS